MSVISRCFIDRNYYLDWTPGNMICIYGILSYSSQNQHWSKHCPISNTSRLFQMAMLHLWCDWLILWFCLRQLISQVHQHWVFSYLILARLNCHKNTIRSYSQNINKTVVIYVQYMISCSLFHVVKPGMWQDPGIKQTSLGVTLLATKQRTSLTLKSSQGAGLLHFFSTLFMFNSVICPSVWELGLEAAGVVSLWAFQPERARDSIFISQRCAFCFLCYMIVDRTGVSVSSSSSAEETAAQPGSSQYFLMFTGCHFPP